MSRQPAANLRAKAQEFKDELTDLLNATVCNGPRLSAVIDLSTNQAVIGYQITATELRSPAKIGLTISQKPADVYLDLSYRTMLNDSGHLTVFSSYVGLYLAVTSATGPVEHRPLLHYDYEREKTNYTQAHVQIVASSPDWEYLLGSRNRSLERLHLPVGGLRYRPTLEDVIEFVGDERLAEMHGGHIDHDHPPADEDLPKWKKAVDAGRRGFWEKQLRAAIGRNRELAQEVLSEQ